MAKKITVLVLLVLMILGVSIAVANFLSVKSHADASPCVQVKYLPTVPDCKGPGTSCWDCT